MRSKLQKTLILLLVTVLFTGIMTGIARADRGPKPNITLYQRPVHADSESVTGRL